MLATQRRGNEKTGANAESAEAAAATGSPRPDNNYAPRAVPAQTPYFDKVLTLFQRSTGRARPWGDGVAVNRLRW